MKAAREGMQLVWITGFKCQMLLKEEKKDGI